MIDPLPPAPSRANDTPQDFSDKADAFAAALPTFQQQSNAAVVGINFTTAIPLWVATTTYAVGNAVYSPATFLAYRATTAITGNAGNTDPSVDTARWRQVTGTGNLSSGTSIAVAGVTASGAAALNGGVTTTTLSASGAVSLNGTVSLGPNAVATASDIAGINTTASGTTGTNTITVASSAGVATGQTVTGTGIPVGTTVTVVTGTTITLSSNLTATITTSPVTFYTNSKIVSPGSIGSQVCRAWVNFNGTGTVAIRASFNVSSITDNGTGDYTVNFATPMADANYCVTGATHSTTGTASVFLRAAQTTTSAQFFTTRNTGGTNSTYDSEYVNVAAFR